ncbi:MAG: response regulator [Rhodospirillales bacterium]|nr:response regulator [Rhodospirillales bacterium]
MARILLIDDEKLVRLTGRKMLEAEGHEVSEAENGNEGLAIYQEQSIDLVITDILMPEREGIETILELKKLNPNVKIIAMSGGGRIKNLDYLNMAVAHGVANKLAKPFSRSELITVVTSCIG